LRINFIIETTMYNPDHIKLANLSPDKKIE